MNKSVTLNFVLLTVLLTLGLSVGFVVVSQWLGYESDNEHLTTRLASIAQSTSEMISKPLLDADHEQVKVIIDAVMRSDLISAVNGARVTDSTGIEIYLKGDASAFSGPAVTQQVRSPTQIIGNLQIAYSHDSLLSAAKDRLITSTIQATLVLVAVLLCGVFVLQWRIGKPLKRVAVSLKQDDPQQEFIPIDGGRFNGVAPLLSAYNRVMKTRSEEGRKLLWANEHLENRLAQTASSLEAELDKRQRIESQLKAATEQLEETVQSRTQELVDTNKRLISEISQRTEAEKALAHQATTDSLTGLPNRKALDAIAKEMFDHAVADSASVGIMFLDVDNFKTVNDTLGHSAGDELLRAAVTRIRGIVGDDVAVVRYGGDEFVLLFDKSVWEEKLETVSQEIIKALSEPFEINHQTVDTGASIGISMFPQHGKKLETLLRNADTAMYRSKEAGRGCYTVYSPQLTEETKGKLKLRTALKAAMNTDELVVFFQPIVSMKTGLTTKCEALLRWQHPEQGLLAPNAFLSTAEDYGLIRAIDTRVLDQACKGCRTMRDEGLDVGVSVNLSSTSLGNEDVVDQIVTALTTYDLMPESLSVEITEDAVVDNDEKTLEILNQIRDMGVRLSIDDFGTGYSSLSYLKRLPVRELKIDRAFIRDLPDDETVRSIVISIVGMCRGMGVSTVAEGVEDMTQYQMATNVGCDYVQGYLIAQPLSEKDVIEFLKQAPAYPTRASTVSSVVSKAV